MNFDSGAHALSMGLTIASITRVDQGAIVGVNTTHLFVIDHPENRKDVRVVCAFGRLDSHTEPVSGGELMRAHLNPADDSECWRQLTKVSRAGTAPRPDGIGVR
jgi:hypothetical protein